MLTSETYFTDRGVFHHFIQYISHLYWKALEKLKSLQGTPSNTYDTPLKFGFILTSSDGRVLMERRRGDRFVETTTVPNESFTVRYLLVWGGISFRAPTQ